MRLRELLTCGGLLSALLAGCVPPPPPPLPPPDELVSRVSYAILQPEVSCADLAREFALDLPVVDTPDQIGLAYTEHFLTAADGTVRRLWLLPAAESRGVVLVAMGNSGSMACYLFTAQLLVNNGYTVVIFDYAGFGGSAGDAHLFTLKPDLELALDWTIREAGFSQVTLFGLSLGSIPVVAVAVGRADVVNGVILDSPIAMGAEIERFRVLVAGRTQEVIDALEPWIFAENLIGNMYHPVLVYRHDLDLVAPALAVDVLYGLAPGRKQMLSFWDLGHAAGQFERTAAYNEHLRDFLADVWGQRTPNP